MSDQLAVKLEAQFIALQKSDHVSSARLLASSKNIYETVSCSRSVGSIPERVLAGALAQFEQDIADRVRAEVLDDQRRDYAAKLAGLEDAIKRTVDRFR